VWTGRLAWLGHLLDVQKVAGPNPARSTTNNHLVRVFWLVVNDFFVNVRNET
jgi:hypothetical protein